jgi:hypothetical protein
MKNTLVRTTGNPTTWPLWVNHTTRGSFI